MNSSSIISGPKTDFQRRCGRPKQQSQSHHEKIAPTECSNSPSIIHLASCPSPNLPTNSSDESKFFGRDHHDATPVVPIGGMRKGGSAERFETPPCGGSRGTDVCQRFFAAVQRASGVGGTRPPRLSPAGGNGKGGVQTSLLPQAARAGIVRVPGTPLVYCVLALLPRFSPLRSPNL
jgi:hypothetical protein